jgi:Putative quorum-sensing-regulated virulence factor
MKMPFGKHKGKELSRISLDYLEWVSWLPGLRWGLSVAIEQELLSRRAAIAERHRKHLLALQAEMALETKPRTELGFAMNSLETALFDQAVVTGELVVPLELPATSLLPDFWRWICKGAGVQPMIREIRWLEEQEDDVYSPND